MAESYKDMEQPEGFCQKCGSVKKDYGICPNKRKSSKELELISEELEDNGWITKIRNGKIFIEPGERKYKTDLGELVDFLKENNKRLDSVENSKYMYVVK